MIIIPAVDIRQGRCVRLLQGEMDAETVFSQDPVAMALQWEACGASLLHVVDLDGAISKSPQNLAVVCAIIERLKAGVQVGGGIRSINEVRIYLEAGAQKVVIGTEAIRNPAFVAAACREFPGRIVVGIDAREGMVAVEGWTQTTDVRAVDLAKRFEGCGVSAINFTDIHRDGMQTGPNIEETRKLAESTTIPVVASGGVSSIRDVRNLLPLADIGVVGVITGRALYEGTLDLKEAIALANRPPSHD
jgi:phosphoribosylformimino-5-aminoimidazole carboxamide ribotide isomerase